MSIHNIHFLIHMLRDLRRAVEEGRTEEFAVDFFKNYYKHEKEGVPQWIKNALAECGIKL